MRGRDELDIEVRMALQWRFIGHVRAYMTYDVKKRMCIYRTILASTARLENIISKTRLRRLTYSCSINTQTQLRMTSSRTTVTY
jgi:hypothetical protein